MQSHPTWVRGLKQLLPRLSRTIVMSHPTWVRGLKQFVTQHQQERFVAPYVGAWIETTIAAIAAQNPEGRTLRGCVD